LSLYESNPDVPTVKIERLKHRPAAAIGLPSAPPRLRMPRAAQRAELRAALRADPLASARIPDPDEPLYSDFLGDAVTESSRPFTSTRDAS
jgi:hypothetical protein